MLITWWITLRLCIPCLPAIACLVAHRSRTISCVWDVIATIPRFSWPSLVPIVHIVRHRLISIALLGWVLPVPARLDTLLWVSWSRLSTL